MSRLPSFLHKDDHVERAGLVGWSHTLAQGQGIALHNVVHAVKAIGHTQALEAVFGELDERLGSVTPQGEHAGAQGLQPLVHQCLPRGVGAIVCHLCLYYSLCHMSSY